MATQFDSHHARQFVESAGQIDMRNFQITIGVFTGMAFCFFVARIGIRLRYQKGLRIDDGFLIAAAVCLAAATGILYHICYYLYLHATALLAPHLLPFLIADFGELFQLQKWMDPLLVLIWTTIFAVKGCFLAFMRPLVFHISRAMNRYYWLIVVFCVLSWAYFVASPFILCPYFGIDAVRCWSITVDERKTLRLTILSIILDIISDIMVASLPIMILRGSDLSRSTKFGLSVFLCLSIFMAICAIARIAGFHYKGREDDTWAFFWQHIEGTVAVMMAAVTAFRTLFIRPSDSPNLTTPRSPVESWLHQLVTRFQALAKAKPEPHAPLSVSGPETSALQLPRMPRPALTGLRSFIHRDNRTAATTGRFISLHSDVSATVEDYHTTLKMQNH